jgi:hypothetical protein
MGTIAFTRNHSDHSNNNGFQFEFFCDKCGNGRMSEFKPNAMGVASTLLRAAGSIFGGVLNNAAAGADHVKDALRGGARDDAFKEAVEACKPHFRHCTKCGKWVCPESCWNDEVGLCEDCAPNLTEHAASISAHVAVEQLHEKARQSDQTGGMDMKQKKVAVCPHCKAPNQSGKFCNSCGKPVAGAKVFCAECGKEMAATAKFCGECGSARTA